MKESATFAPGHKDSIISSKTDKLKELKVGNRILKNPSLTVMPDDAGPMKGYQGFLGLPCFKDTVMVLDFENNLMWIKN